MPDILSMCPILLNASSGTCPVLLPSNCVWFSTQLHLLSNERHTIPTKKVLIHFLVSHTRCIACMSHLAQRFVRNVSCFTAFQPCVVLYPTSPAQQREAYHPHQKSPVSPNSRRKSRLAHSIHSYTTYC